MLAHHDPETERQGLPGAQYPLRRRLAMIGTVAALGLVACGDDDSSEASASTTMPATTAAAEPTTTATTAPATGAPSTPVPVDEPVREGGDDTAPGVASREEAEQAALDAVGSGTVTWSGPEDDRGAAWEVEITRPDGSEVDVLVAADGTVIKQVEKLGQGPALAGPGTPPAGGVVSQQEAERAALAAVGEGRVTWVGREDERGAAWEVEITRPDGTEIDVLIAPDGSVID